MSEIQELSAQVAKLKTDAGASAKALYERCDTIDKQIAAIQKLMEGTARGNYREVIYGMTLAREKLSEAADDLLAAWNTAENWLARVGGGSSSSAPASGGTAFSGPAQTEATQGNEAGAAIPSGLTCTKQETEKIFINGRWCNIFDHPFNANSKRICKQGSAYPDGPTGTCGCCASGSIVNKAGGNTNEHDIVDIALKNGFCSNSGGTSSDSRAKLLTHMGIDSEVTTGSSLEDLAAQVEQGKGVIISVDARRYKPEWYSKHGGHALVLESVIRDADTGGIVEFVVVDSNGDDSLDAVVRVDPDTLRNAFGCRGSQSVTTKNIIW